MTNSRFILIGNINQVLWVWACGLAYILHKSTGDGRFVSAISSYKLRVLIFFKPSLKHCISAKVENVDFNCSPVNE